MFCHRPVLLLVPHGSVLCSFRRCSNDRPMLRDSVLSFWAKGLFTPSPWQPQCGIAQLNQKCLSQPGVIWPCGYHGDKPCVCVATTLEVGDQRKTVREKGREREKQRGVELGRMDRLTIRYLSCQWVLGHIRIALTH